MSQPASRGRAYWFVRAHKGPRFVAFTNRLLAGTRPIDCGGVGLISGGAPFLSRGYTETPIEPDGLSSRGLRVCHGGSLADGPSTWAWPQQNGLDRTGFELLCATWSTGGFLRERRAIWKGGLGVLLKGIMHYELTAISRLVHQRLKFTTFDPPCSCSAT